MSKESKVNWWLVIPPAITAAAALIAALAGNGGLINLITKTPNPNPNPTATIASSSDIPLIILLDNSGSMGICSVTKKENGKDVCIPNAEKPYKIDVVKKTILHRLDSSNSIADLGSTRIGLVEFGNWQSYGAPGTPEPIPSSANSVFKCQAVKVLAEPEINNHQKLINILSENTIMANDSGVTPLGFAINSVIYDILEPKNLLPARILLVTDGYPNCTDEYKFKLCDIVAGLKERKVDLTVDIVGYKANSIDESTGQRNDKEFIDCAKRYANVRYWGSRNTSSELSSLVDKVVSYPN